MPIALDDPLTASEHKALATFLAECASGVTPNLEALDGFFCALIVGPDVVLPSEYLPLVLGDHNRFDDGEEANRVLPLLMRHWNTIAQTLNQGEGSSRVTSPSNGRYVEANQAAPGPNLPCTEPEWQPRSDPSPLGHYEGLMPSA